MNVIQYLKKMNIEYEPINLKKTWNATKDKYEKAPQMVKTTSYNYQPKCTDFQKLTKEEIQKRQEYIDKCTHIGIDVSNCHHIDVDIEPKMFGEQLVTKMKETFPYFESVTKKLPHFLVQTNLSQTPQRVQTIYEGIEILSGGWAFCEKDAVIHNAHLPIQNLDVTKITTQPMIQEIKNISTKVKYEDLENVTLNLDKCRKEEYHDWLNVIFAIIHTGQENNYYHKAVALAHEWSKTHEKYDYKYLTSVIEKYYRHDKAPKFGTLCYYLKQDNPQLMKKLSTPMMELNDVTAADEFTRYAEEKGHKFAKYDSEIFWYEPKEGLWKQNLDGIRQLMKECETLDVYQTSTRRQNDMMVQFKDSIKNEPNFHQKAYQSTYRKFAFKNGIYDFNTKKLINFDHKYIFFNKLAFDYTENINKPLTQKIKQKIFFDVFDEDRGQYFMDLVSRSIAGEVGDKTFNIVVGDGNSGKGVNSTINENAFGKFCMTFNAEDMAMSKVQGDKAKARSWMIPLQYARMVISNEVQMNMPLDGNKIKEFSGGGDTMCARANFKNEINFKLQCTPFYFVNDVPQMKPMMQELKNRLKYIDTQYSYLDGALYENQKGSPNVKKADPTIKEVFCTNPEVLQTYAIMICQNYKPTKPHPPDNVLRSIEEWTEADDVSNEISNLFTATNNEEDFIKATTIINIVRFAKIQISPTKLGRILNKQGFIKTRKKIEQKTCVVYTHIKQTQDTHE